MDDSDALASRTEVEFNYRRFTDEVREVEYAVRRIVGELSTANPSAEFSTK
jgi:hypothetical protein